MELTGRLEGPVVTALDAVFATDWYNETGEVLDGEVGPGVDGPPAERRRRDRARCVPSGPGFPTENNLRLFNTLSTPPSGGSP